MKLSRAVATAAWAVASLPTTGATSAMAAVEIFDGDSCSGAPLQIVFSPCTDCSRLSADLDCSLEAKDLGLFASGSYTDDPTAFSAAAFGASPFVLVELYTPETNCETLEGVAAYRLDSVCHPTVDAGTSFQVDWDGATPTFKLFADQSCSSTTPTYELDLAIDGGECIGGSMRLRVNVSDSASTSALASAPAAAEH
ncbi:unnamed protein product [Phytophthora fragariaefolia]|uniref:Unnamed protein product n=1 Tax=Phytophthora fragariaefolia TaxID=1490495 RepID=A0A9W7D087_9STRA|nr:unnamed protein product [Phytophthora fragariaefolia]